MKKAVLFILLTLPWLGARAAVDTGGWVTAISITTNGAGNRSAVFTLTNGVAEVTPYAPDVVRVRFHFNSLYPREEPAIAKSFDSWPAFTSTFTNLSATNYLIQTDLLDIEVVKTNKFQVHFKDKSGYDLLRDFQIEFDSSYHQIDDTDAYAQVTWTNESSSVSNLPSGFKLKSIKVMPSDEAYFGAGDFGGPLNRRGRILQYWNQDTYQFGEYRNPKYMALPFYYGVRPATSSNAAKAYGVFFNNPARPVIEFTSGFGDTYAFSAGDDQLDYFFFGGGSNHTMQACLDRYTELTGRPAMLPKWAYGYHQSRHSYDTQQKVQDLADQMRASNMPCDAIYLDIGHQEFGSQNHQLTFNAVSYSNVPGMIAYCTNIGVRLVPIVEPCLTTNDPLYGEALTNLYFIKNNDLSTYVGTNFLGSISWLDFSIVDTFQWWLRKQTNYLAQFPVEAIWNDLNEPNENGMPINNLFYLDGRYGGGSVTNDTRKWLSVNKNTYALLNASNSYTALRQRYPSRRPFVLARSAWPGIQSWAAGWSGDNVSSFDHMRFGIRMGVSVMMSGQANYGHDIGGFIGDSSGELLARWMEWGVLNPLCRNHADNFSTNQEPWAFGEPYTLWNRRWIQFRYELMPYLYTLARESTTSGVPMNTPAVFQFMSDTNTWSQNEYDFMVGRSILAAPVYVTNGTTRSVYLPSNTAWYGWYDDVRYAGGQTVLLPASLGALPMLVRAGGIVPMGPVMDYVSEFQPSYLNVHAWPGASNEFVLYEDDGLTTNFLSGEYARTRISQTQGTNTWTFNLAAREGSYNPGSRSFFLVAHAASNATAVTCNGTNLLRFANRAELESLATNGWSYDAPARRLTVKVTDTGGALDVVATFDQATYAPPAFASAFSNMAVAGPFTYWNESARNMRLVSNGLWAGVIDLTGHTNIEFKFVANDHWAFTNWGAAGQTNVAMPVSDTAAPQGSNLMANGVFTGAYTFTFNESNLVFSVAPAGQRDSDRDGADDRWEYYYGLDGLASTDGSLDADADGLANSNEFAAAGNPVRSDTDGDGVGDLSEFIAGTSLTNASSYFFVESETLVTTNSGVLVMWTAVTGRSYEVFYATNLLAGAGWVTLAPFTNVTGSGPVAVNDTNGVIDRYYRVGVRRP